MTTTEYNTIPTTREAFPNPDRPIFWPGEEDHFRSDFRIGDLVRLEYGSLGRITSFNNTWSHVRGGRIVHVEPLLTYPGTVAPSADARPWQRDGDWENNLTVAQPGDIASHIDRPGFGWTAVRASWQ